MGCNNLRKTLIITLAILCSIILVLPVLAGQGDGSGGGKNQPLAMLSSSPADGQKDVALPVEIKMTFSKNVVYMTVRDNNSKCFTMYSQDGKQVPIEVIMADDQIEFDKRRDIVVKPLQELQAGTTYMVKVAPQLESKSGVNLGKETTLSFTTAGFAAIAVDPAASTSTDMAANPAESSTSDSEQETPASEQITSGEQGEIPEQLAESKAEDSNSETKREESTAGEKENNDKGINTGIIIAIIIITTALVYAIFKKRGKQQRHD